jgi:hypothetical protein
VRICVAEPARAQEAEREAEAEVAQEVRNGMRVHHGEGSAQGGARNREGQDAHREAFDRWRGEREVVWARGDVLGCLDGTVLPVLDWMLHLDEESRGCGLW